MDKEKMKAVFLDRDGTINKDVNYCRRIEDFEILPGVPEAIRLLNQHNFKVIVITNQSGISRGYFSEATLLRIHQHMENELVEHNAYIDAIYFCPHHPDEDCECRKPKPGLIMKAAQEHDIDLMSSYMIGDELKDIVAGQAVGCKTIWLQKNTAIEEKVNCVSPDYIAPDILTAVNWILRKDNR